ncbi:MAG: hypothetical protein KDC83_13110 [Flavobacteriales bacterium]|nr:hypothetical protein [Flavobacteriales bacterium]
MNRSFVCMDIQAEKISLIQWIAGLSDENLIAKIRALRGEKTDWWDELGEATKADIEEGIGELNRGEKHAYEDVVSKHR